MATVDKAKTELAKLQSDLKAQDKKSAAAQKAWKDVYTQHQGLLKAIEAAKKKGDSSKVASLTSQAKSLAKTKAKLDEDNMEQLAIYKQRKAEVDSMKKTIARLEDSQAQDAKNAQDSAR